MSTEVTSAVKKLPAGVEGFAAGFVLGFVADRVMMYAWTTWIDPEGKIKPPIFAGDDWILIGIGVLVSIKKPMFGFGWLLAVLLSSGFIPKAAGA